MLALKGGTPVRTKAFSTWPERGEAEVERLKKVLTSGSWGGYPAPNSEARAFGAEFSKYIGTQHAILAANGTVTLKVILRALGIKAGDEVIVPSLTWIATAGAAAYINAVPVFADVDPETLCIDPQALDPLITEQTRAIICVHLGSTMADVDALTALCKKRGLFLIEDCAHVHGMKWNQKAAGSFGHAGSFSFQSSKLLTSGEGGAITTSDAEIAQRCQSLVNCGRKEDFYTDFAGPQFGWNDRITEFQAALLSAQLARLDEQHERRQKNLAHFEKRLAELGDVGLRFQKRDPHISRHVFYQLVMLYEAHKWKNVSRDRFAAALEAEGIPVDGAFYVPIPDRIGEIFPLKASEYPLIRSRYGEALTPEQAQCMNASKAAYEQTLWFHHSMFLGSTDDVDDIVEAIVKVREGIDALV